MTLGEFFDILSANPAIIIFYFTAVPLTALLASLFSKGEGHLSPWRELFSVLLYLAAVPGIFGLMLSIYLFLFERQSLLDTNIFTQILPILSMILTIYLIKRHVNLDHIPGFDRLNGLFFMVFAILLLLWLMDRTHIFAIVSLPFYAVLLIIIVLIVVARIGWRRFSS